MDFNFSFRCQDKTFEIFNEERELERLRKKKNISSLLDTISAAVGSQGSLVYKYLRRLSLVLATESPSTSFSLR